MASCKEYLHFILEQLSDLDDVSYRPMMGEFILYYIRIFVFFLTIHKKIRLYCN